MNTIRAFIAIPLPDEVKRTVSAVSGQLANAGAAGVRWVKPNAMHLTLRFLGDTDTGRLPQIDSALDEAARSQPTFSLQLDRLGAFPNTKRPRVLWLGPTPVVPAPSQTLVNLKRSIDEALAPLGYPPEVKPFAPHLTLGRLRDSSQTVNQLAWDMAVPQIIFPVMAVHLVESDLRPDGPWYTIRHASALSPDQTNR